MIVNRVFTCTLYTDNPCSFAEDLQASIISKLQDIYVNVFYMDSLILKINKVINQSNIRILNYNATAGGTLHVQFEASCLIVEVNEIFANVLICKKTMLLIGKYTDPTGNFVTAVCISNQDALAILDKDMKVAAICTSPLVTHALDKTSIMHADILTCKRQISAFKIKQPISSEIIAGNTEVIKTILDLIADELSIRERLISTDSKFSDRLMFLENVYFSYDNSKQKKIDIAPVKIGDKTYKWIGPFYPTNNKINFIEYMSTLIDKQSMSDDDVCIWGRFPTLFGSSPYIIKTTEKIKCVDGNITNLIAALKEIYNYLVVMREMALSYTDNDIEDYFKFWLYLKKFKLSE